MWRNAVGNCFATPNQARLGYISMLRLRRSLEECLFVFLSREPRRDLSWILMGLICLKNHFLHIGNASRIDSQTLFVRVSSFSFVFEMDFRTSCSLDFYPAWKEWCKGWELIQAYLDTMWNIHIASNHQHCFVHKIKGKQFFGGDSSFHQLRLSVMMWN